MSDAQSLSFQTGIPTKPDIDRLLNEIGIPQEGEEITYERISGVIREERESPRWKTVTSAWRNVLYREHNLVTESVPGKAIRVATPSERVHHSASKYKAGLRRVYRAGDVAQKTSIQDLKAEEQRACTHIVNATAALRLAAAQQAKQLRIKDPQQS